MYNQARRTLKRSYGNKTACRDALLRKFELILPIRKATVELMRELLSEFDVTHGALLALKVRKSDYERRFESTIVLRVPRNVQEKITQLREAKFDKIRRIIDDELCRLERLESLCYDVQQTDRSSKPPTAKAATARVNSASVAVIACVFCNGGHKSAECTTYATFRTRTERVQALGLCVTCMRPSHLGEQCKRKGRCYGCQGDHFRYLCPKASGTMAVIQISETIGETATVLNVQSFTKQQIIPLLNAVGRKSLMTMFVRTPAHAM